MSLRPQSDKPISDEGGNGRASQPGWSQKLQKPLWLFLLFLAGMSAAFVGVWLYAHYQPPPEPLSAEQVDEIVTDTLASATPGPAHAALVYDTILPSLVFIATHKSEPVTGSMAKSQPAEPTVPEGSTGDIALQTTVRYQGGNDPEGDGPGKDDGDEDGDPKKDEPVGIGSGVVVNGSGAILTALHVVEGAAIIELTFADGTRAEGTIIGAEPENDIALLQADRLPELFAPATLGNPGAMRVGDEAYAVGNPLGLAGSLSAGVISGFDRSFRSPDGERELDRLIQFDAAVNPGNSGGPLLNRNGEVIGIVVALINPTPMETFIGIGLAVRIDTAGGVAGLPPQ